MLIFAIDDEPKMLRLLHKALTEALPDAEIMDFPLGTAAVKAIEEQRILPDVIFSDIQMPGLDGLALAVRIKQLSPYTRIIFVTGYDEYAVEAYRLHASGYIMKPVDADRVLEEINHIDPPSSQPSDRLVIQCFGYFEVFWKGKPLQFGRRQSKELLAFLVDRVGASCTSEEAIAALWEHTDPEDMKNAKQRIRNLINDLKTSLGSIGMGDVLIRQGSRLAIRKELLDCDYFRMLDGDMTAVNEFRGQYMEQYSWAELTRGDLVFRNTKGA